MNFFTVKDTNGVLKMPTEVKQRKKPQKQSEEASEISSLNGKNEGQKVKLESGKNAGVNKTSSSWDMRSIMCLMSLIVCGALSW